MPFRLRRKHQSNVVAIYELAAHINKEGAEKITGMNIGGTVQLDDVAVTMVEAKHSAGVEGKNGTQYAGVAAGFVLTISDGPVLYHAGDTTVFSDMKLIKELYHPEIAMLPIGGFYTMGPQGSCTCCAIPGAECDPAHSLRDVSATDRHPRRA